MLKLYKGNLIIITKGINGKGSFKAKFKLYYRYSFFRMKKYEHTVTLSEVMTLDQAYQALKEFIDGVEQIVKLKTK